jgi:putative ABC transport system permease protein
MEIFRRDLGFALRSLRRRPLVSGAALGVLSLGSGLTFAVLLLVHRGLAREAGQAPAGQGAVWEHGWSEAARLPVRMQAESLGTMLWILAAATGLVLLMAILNLGILQLARTGAREQEFTVRVVVGAGRLRLARQLITEVGTLTLLGGVLGFVVSGAALAALQVTWPESLPRWLGSGPAAAASLVSFGLPASSALCFGLLPLRLAGRQNLARSLGGGSRLTPGPDEGVLRRWSIIVAVATSASLLVGAGLMLRGFSTIGGAPGVLAGFDPADTLTLRLDFAGAGHRDPARLAAAQANLLAQLETDERLGAASLASEGTWIGMGAEDLVTAQCGNCFRGGMWLPVTRGPARHHVVSPGYFAAMGIPLLEGHEFTRDQSAGSEPVAVISRTFAHQIFLGRPAVGRPIQIGGAEGGWHTVIGVVGDVRVAGLGNDGEPVAAVYLSTLQHPPAVAYLAIRTPGPPAAYAASVSDLIGASSPRLVPDDVLSMEARLQRHAAPLRWLSGIFALLAAYAATIAALGLFAVIAHLAGRRTREMGVRLAVGARPGQVVRLVVGQGVRLTLVGAWLGLLGGLCVARLLHSQFLGVAMFDAAVYLGVAGLLLSVALIASYLPARRAAGVDPAVALRPE